MKVRVGNLGKYNEGKLVGEWHMLALNVPFEGSEKVSILMLKIGR